jgi:hypothetical protein
MVNAHVRRVYTDGRVKEYGKQNSSLRRVPLRARVVAALEEHPWRIDTQLVYSGERGGPLNLHAWRRDEWYPALDSAGAVYLARLMGTSVQQFDATYGHMLPDSEEYLRGLLDGYDRETSNVATHLSACG